MPQAIPLITGFIASGVVAATGAYAFVAALAGGIVAYGTTKLLGLDEPPGLDDPGLRANVRGTVQPIPIVYGRREVGGVLAQICTTGKVQTEVTIPAIPSGAGTYDIPDEIDNKYLNIVLCWAEGEIEGVQLLYLDDKLSTSTKFTGFLTVEHYTGTDDQVASPGFLAALAKSFDAESAARLWSSEHRLRGIAYTYCKLLYDPNVWVTGIPVITAEIKGRKVLDLRTDVWAWSDNPALIIYDYLTNTRFGRGIDASEIDTESFIEAANYCDQQIYIETQVAVPPDIPSAGVTQARYACDAILNPDDTHLDNLRILLATCRGALVFSGGLYKLKLDKPEPSTFNLTEDNIVGGWNIILESSESRFNRVQVQWPDRTNRYQDNYTFLTSQTFLDADNGEVFEAKIDLPATCQYLRPKQMAGMVLRQSRYSLQCEVLCTIEGLACEVYDVISVTHELPGWENQLFRVMGISLESDDQVRLQLQQYADDVYDLDSQNDEDSPPPTNLPNPLYVEPIYSLAAVPYYETYPDGTARAWYVLVIRTINEMVNVSGFRVRWRIAGSGSQWQSRDTPNDRPIEYDPGNGNVSREYVVELDAVQANSYEVECVTLSRLGVQSDVYATTLDPIGSQDPPPSLAALDADGAWFDVLNAIRVVRLRWVQAGDATGGNQVEVYKSATSSFSNAVLLGTFGPTIDYYFDFTVAAGTFYWYWARQISTTNVAGPYLPSESGAGETALTPS